MVQAWRIVHEKYAHSAFDGEGARLTGGRWNTEGTAMVYTAGALSLALLEIIVHLEFAETLKFFKAIPIRFEESTAQSIDPADLPANWTQSPPLWITQARGNYWIKTNSSAILRVPSVVVPFESNYLLNPRHPDFKTIVIGKAIDLPVDPRMMAKLQS